MKDTVLLGKQRPQLNRGVLLDPPYSGEEYLYRDSGKSAARDSYEWAVGNGENNRIAYCCKEGDFPVPARWQGLTRVFASYGPGRGKTDMVMFSPACLGERRFPRTGRRG